MRLITFSEFQEHTIPIFKSNESVNSYDTRGGKSLFIPQVNTSHYAIKSLRYNDPVIWNDFFPNTDNNKNLCDTGIYKLKYYLKDLLISQYIKLNKSN